MAPLCQITPLTTQKRTSSVAKNIEASFWSEVSFKIYSNPYLTRALRCIRDDQNPHLTRAFLPLTNEILTNDLNPYLTRQLSTSKTFIQLANDEIHTLRELLSTLRHHATVNKIRTLLAIFEP